MVESLLSHHLYPDFGQLAREQCDNVLRRFRSSDSSDSDSCESHYLGKKRIRQRNSSESSFMTEHQDANDSVEVNPNLMANLSAYVQPS
jgi:hypothetical protein